MDRRTLLKALALYSGALLTPQSVLAGSKARITDIRIWTAPDHTRIVFDLDKAVKHTLFPIKDPERWVLDIEGVQLAAKFPAVGNDPLLAVMRNSMSKNDTLRVVFEIKQPVKPRSFFLKQSKEKNPRIVVDLFHLNAVEENKPQPVESKPQRDKNLVVVFDPGHGGEDPGAIGAKGTHEKHIALAVGNRLVSLFNSEPGFRAHLTRKGDYFIPLRQRVAIARRHSPDLFISLHADAFRVQSARGASVYCLSERGKPSPDRAIEELARRENSTDLIGGVDLGDVNDQEVAGILMDLSQRDSINRAIVLGERLLNSLKEVTGLKYDDVQPAGFMVLKAPDIPSVLVEMAFLTNPEEEALLRQPGHQEKLSHSIFEGVRSYARLSRSG